MSTALPPGNACPAALAPQIDAARARATVMLDRTIATLELVVSVRKQRGFDGPLGGRTARVIRNALGPDVAEVEGRLSGEPIRPVIENLEMMNAAVGSTQVLCATVHEPPGDVGCGLMNAGFHTEAVPQTIFLCGGDRGDASTFGFASRTPTENGELLVHELAHSEFGAGHEGLADPLNSEEVSVPMAGDCDNPMGLDFGVAVNNAYVYESLVACLHGTKPVDIGKEAFQKAQKERVARAEAIDPDRRRAASRLMSRLEKDRRVPATERNLRRARDLLMLDQARVLGFQLGPGVRVRARMMVEDWTNFLGVEHMDLAPE